MKACPACNRLYPDEASFCAADGQSLRSATQVPVQSSDDERVGTLVAMRYQIRRVVADGGMGRVYEALDLQGKRRVAVKMLHADVANDEVAVERFKREFEVSHLLPHDYIVEVIGFRQEGGTYALVMEFLEGEELRTVLKREKTITPGRLVRMVSQLALGLDPAHRQHLIHRDLKPDNVFLCGDRDGDRVKLLDFGSVKDKSFGAKKLTVLGTTIGSPYYMAPEQAQGLETLDHRADVWAIAAIAYECITGTVPFAGSNGPTILLSILTKDPIPPSVAGKEAAIAVPHTLDELMSEALAKNPNYRTPSVGDLAQRLGLAYGLIGDYQGWAITAQHVLDESIQQALARQPARVQAASVMADPFAAPSATPTFANPQAIAQPTGGHAMDEAFRTDMAKRSDESTTEENLGRPKPGAPAWLIPLLIGIGFLVVGIVVAILFLLQSPQTRS